MTFYESLRDLVEFSLEISWVSSKTLFQYISMSFGNSTDTSTTYRKTGSHSGWSHDYIEA